MSATPSVGSYASGTGVWTIGALANGASATLTITATVLAGGPYLNSASVTATTQDPNPVNNSASAGTTPVAQADLQVAKTVNNGAPNVGTNVTFTIAVTNNGPSSAANVQVTDALPAGYTFVSATPSVGSYDSGTGVWSGIGTLASGGGATLTITATVLASGPYLNTATGTSTTTDPNPNNNTASAGVSPVAVASLAVTKTDNSANYTPGGTGTYVVVVTNGGPSAASSVTVSDTLPAGVTLAGTVTCAAAGTATCGSVTGTAGQGSFGTTGATIGAGAGNSLTFTVPVAYASAMTTDPLVNTATATDPAEPQRVRQRQQRAAAQGDAGGGQDRRQQHLYAGRHRDLRRDGDEHRAERRRQRHGHRRIAGGTHAHRGGHVHGQRRRDVRHGHRRHRPDELRHDRRHARCRRRRFAGLHGAGRLRGRHDGQSARQYGHRDRRRDRCDRQRRRLRHAGGAGRRSPSSRPTAAPRTTPGGTATYTITVTNGGLSTANNVTIADALPAGVTLTASGHLRRQRRVELRHGQRHRRAGELRRDRRGDRARSPATRSYSPCRSPSRPG